MAPVGQEDRLYPGQTLYAETGAFGFGLMSSKILFALAVSLAKELVARVKEASKQKRNSFFMIFLLGLVNQTKLWYLNKVNNLITKYIVISILLNIN